MEEKKGKGIERKLKKNKQMYKNSGHLIQIGL